MISCLLVMVFGFGWCLCCLVYVGCGVCVVCRIVLCWLFSLCGGCCGLVC